MTGDTAVPHVRRNWQPVRMTWWSKRVIFLTNSSWLYCFILAPLPVGVKGEELKRQWGHYKYINVCSHSFTSPCKCFPFLRPLHIASSWLSVFTFLSFSLSLPTLCTITTGSSLFALSLSWHFFPSRGLRPAVWAVSSVLNTTTRDSDGLGNSWGM